MNQDHPPTEGLTKSQKVRKALKWIFGLGFAGAIAGTCFIVFVFACIYRQLPSLDTLTDYRPKVPLRIWSADGKLIGEFGDERRDFVPLKDIPLYVREAILSAEDSDFYKHPGIEITGIARAAVTNLIMGRKVQGGSTITQQVAKNFFLSSERTYTRKLYEIAMSFKIEHLLTKDQILEIYMNQIYLGQRAYGFASAAQTYFGKPLNELTVGEAATIAGLPVAPSAYNPIKNPAWATMRRNYVLKRMYELGYIDQATYDTERTRPMETARSLEAQKNPDGLDDSDRVSAQYAAEIARNLIYNIFGKETYSRGLNVYTTINTKDQDIAVDSVRSRLIEYDRRYGYRGPEGFVDISSEDPKVRAQAIRSALAKTARSPFMIPAIVVVAKPNQLVVATNPSETIVLDKESLHFARRYLKEKPPASVKEPLRPGSIVRIMRHKVGKGKNAQEVWTLAQVPRVEAAFVSADFNTGAVRALVGGFDYNLNMFNHVTQAWRQPGSSFKPFIYSAALDKGFTMTTVVNDAPILIDPKLTGGRVWEPKNYEGTYDGPMPLYKALELSKNLVTIRVMQAITPEYAQQFVQKFGFSPEHQPANLPMALGAGSVTPWEMLRGYMVFANGGYRVQPYLIERVTDADGKVLMRNTNRTAGDESIRAIQARNAFIMNALLHDVATEGTAARATRELKRNDIAGKTGTTNDSHDAWFCGYAGNQVAVGWMGYDNPKPLGNRETGGGLVLPIWIDYMNVALQGVPETIRSMPDTVIENKGFYYYKDPVQGVAIGDELAPTNSGDTQSNKHSLVRDQIF